MERKHYLSRLAQEVEDVIEESKCSPTYVAMFRDVLGRSGGILSASPRGEWGSLVLLTCRSASRGEWRKAVPVAAAMEVLAAALETFDDLEDDDDPRCHQFKSAKGHLTNTAYGLLVLSHRCIRRLVSYPGMANKALAVAGVLSGVSLVAGNGQHLDLLFEGRTDVSQEECLDIASQKSAGLVSGACRLGALLGTKDNELVEQYARFGWHVGMAAQLENDIDGVRAGEQSKSDIRRLKPILPLAYYAEGLRSSGAEPLTGEDLDEEEVRRAVWETGAVHYTWVIADLHRQKADEILSEIEKMRPARAMLGHLVASGSTDAPGAVAEKEGRFESPP